MHKLEERCSDFQSVNSISKDLTDVTDSSEFRYPYFRLPLFKNVVLPRGVALYVFRHFIDGTFSDNYRPRNFVFQFY